MLLLRSLVLLLLLTRSASAVELVPASDADYDRLARLTAGAWLAWADGDTEAILAAEDDGLLAWLNRERSLALTLPADRLLPPFAGEAFPCVPLTTTLRILSARQIPPKVLNDLSVAVLLERALTLSAAIPEVTLAAMIGKSEARRAELEMDPAATFRRLQFGFLIGGERAWLTGPVPAVSVATRDPGGRWHIDWRLPLALEEWSARVSFAYGSPATWRVPPSEWPVDAYLGAVSAAIPGYPAPEELLRLAEPSRPDPTQGCWRPLLDPTLMLCKRHDGWGPCTE